MVEEIVLKMKHRKIKRLILKLQKFYFKYIQVILF
jgi:hypothetical protein